jgi:hypothetical protein
MVIGVIEEESKRSVSTLDCLVRGLTFIVDDVSREI